MRRAWVFWGLFILGLVLRLIFALNIPFGNDEAYYWDWGRDLQVSFVDHPPGVSWLSLFGKYFTSSPLGGRILVPILYFFSSCLLLGSLKILAKTAEQFQKSKWTVLFLSQMVPVFSLGGFFLLPDAGLIFALSLTLWLSLTFLQQDAQFKVRWGIYLGLSLGLAGLFKYHALPIGGAILAGILYLRGKKTNKEIGFWIALFIVGIFTTLPVWWWNFLNHWASFRFQGEHGFGNLSFKMIPAVQFFVGIMALLSPGYFLLLTKNVLGNFHRDWKEKNLSLLGNISFLLLFILFGILSFGKQMLPHWIIPVYWLTLPSFALVYTPDFSKKRWKLNTVYLVFLTFVIPSILAFKPFRSMLISTLNENPGALGELTLWGPLVEAMQAEKETQSFLKGEYPPGKIPSSCPKQLPIASLRWFWVAHLAANLPNQPKVFNFDLNHPSYYSFRDDLRDLAGCPVFVIGAQDHWNDEALKDLVAISNRGEIEVAGHKGIAVRWGIGKIHAREDLKNFPPGPYNVQTKLQHLDWEMQPIQYVNLDPQSLRQIPTNVPFAMDYPPENPGEAYPGEKSYIGAKCKDRESYSIDLGERLWPYFGTLHSHTNASDGKGNLEDAYLFARDKAKLDFFAVTDHSDLWGLSPRDYFSETKNLAENATTKDFVGLWGFEYTHFMFGHYIVLNSSHYRSSFGDFSLEKFYNWLAGEEALVFFAHPGFHRFIWPREFEHFVMDPKLKEKIVGMETMHWEHYSRFFRSYESGESFFDEAMQKGWKLAPVGSQDTHGKNAWGTDNKQRVALLLPKLSREEIVKALKQRRFYATNALNMVLGWNLQTQDGKWKSMGDDVNLGHAKEQTLMMRVRFWDVVGVAKPKRVEFIANGKKLAEYKFQDKEQAFSGEIVTGLKFPIQEPGAKGYVYVRLYQGEDEAYLTQSAPIFLSF